MSRWHYNTILTSEGVAREMEIRMKYRLNFGNTVAEINCYNPIYLSRATM